MNFLGNPSGLVRLLQIFVFGLFTMTAAMVCMGPLTSGIVMTDWEEVDQGIADVGGFRKQMRKLEAEAAADIEAELDEIDEDQLTDEQIEALDAYRERLRGLASRQAAPGPAPKVAEGAFYPDALEPTDDGADATWLAVAIAGLFGLAFAVAAAWFMFGGTEPTPPESASESELDV